MFSVIKALKTYELIGQNALNATAVYALCNLRPGVSKPGDSGLDFSNCSEVWQAPRQQRQQISGRFDN